jgi:hypothetical protein
MKQMNFINDTIQKAAVDCQINKNINFFDKKIFEKINPIEVIDSQGDKHSIQLGQNTSPKNICNNQTNPKHYDDRNFIKDKLKLKKTIMNKIIQYIQHPNNQHLNWISLSDLLENLQFYDIEKFGTELFFISLNEIVYPKKPISRVRIHIHKNGIYIIRDSSERQNKVVIEKVNYLPSTLTQEPDEPKNTNNDNNQKLQKGLSKNELTDDIDVIDFFSFITPQNISQKISDLFGHFNSSNGVRFSQLLDELYKIGLIISRHEISKEMEKQFQFKNHKYIGYFDPFQMEKNIAYIYQNENITHWKELPKNETDHVIKNRIHYSAVFKNSENKEKWAIGRISVKKSSSNFVFRLFTNKNKKDKNDDIENNQAGTECVFLDKANIVNFIKTGNELFSSDKPIQGTKKNLCLTLQKFLHERSSLLFPIQYMPKS